MDKVVCPGIKVAAKLDSSKTGQQLNNSSLKMNSLMNDTTYVPVMIAERYNCKTKRQH